MSMRSPHRPGWRWPAASDARRAAGIAAVLCTVLLVAGCFNPFSPLISSQRGVSEPPPVPSSPVGVMRLFRWCWENRAIDEYREIFTEDYTFQFSQQDSAGNAFRDRPWIREDEMISATNLFVGGGTESPADRITLDFTAPLIAFPDSRPGKAARWHQEVRVEVQLRVARGESQFEVRGPGLFYLVRGDSAAIPEELRNRGFRPDSTRWYVERWEDETVSGTGIPALAGGSPAALMPGYAVTWGAIKAAFRSSPGTQPALSHAAPPNAGRTGS